MNEKQKDVKIMASKKYRFLITLNAGLEDIAIEELIKLNATLIEQSRSRVIVESDFEFIFRSNYLSRTAHKVYFIILEDNYVSSIDDLIKKLNVIPFYEYVSPDQTFAVRFERVGEHSFTSLDINREVGSLIVKQIYGKTGKKLRANLNNPIVEFGGWLLQDRLIFGINTSGKSLHMRGYRKFQHPAPLKPSIASSLVYMSKWSKNQDLILLDPMCGSGTVLIEAALIGRKIPPGYFHEKFAFEDFIFIEKEKFVGFKEKINSEIQWSRKLKLYGLDKKKQFIEGSVTNAKAARVEDTISFKYGDARYLKKHIDVIPDVVIVNPPYGYRMSDHGWIKKLYSDFIKSLVNLNPNIELIAMTADKEMERVATKYFTLIEKKVTLYGRLSTLIYRFEQK